ncbi:M55 family metallopeptidase [bacterium]|nr:M55 family metallopeptidase [bacterium]
MRMYVVTDLEGVAGVYQWENRTDTSPENQERRCRQRRWLAGEVNAMADGFRAGGATDIWINDGHGAGYTIDLDLVRPGVRIEHGGNRPQYCTGLDSTFAGLGSLGTHAMGGTPHASLAHTMGTEIKSYSINGIQVGETGYQAFLAGYYGVPYVFCAGDVAACREMEELCPGCVTVPLKVGLSLLSAMTVTPVRARQMIREGAEEAMRRIGQVRPLTIEGPVLFRDEWHTQVFDPANPPQHSRVIDSHTREIEAENMKDFMDKMYGFDPEYKPLWADDPTILERPS